jgi:hypothetical protein
LTVVLDHQDPHAHAQPCAPNYESQFYRENW